MAKKPKISDLLGITDDQMFLQDNSKIALH